MWCCARRGASPNRIRLAGSATRSFTGRWRPRRWCSAKAATFLTDGRADRVQSLADQENDELAEIRRAVRTLRADFPGEYWRDLDRKAEYPTAFDKSLTEAGFLAALVPEAYGGSGDRKSTRQNSSH